MFSSPLQRRTWLAILIPALLTVGISIVPGILRAETAPVMTFFLRPHCEGSTNDLVIDCPTFEIADPASLKTPELTENATLDIDLVVQNPILRNIVQAKAWIAYNPAILEGISIDPILPVPSPVSNIFSPDDGYIKIDASANKGMEPWVKEIIVARIKMKVKAIPANTAQDVLSFFDVQQNGHTGLIAKKTPTENEEVTLQAPGSLLLTFAHPAAPTETSTNRGIVQDTPDIFGEPATVAMQTSSQSSVQTASSISAAAALCGNSILEAGEACDDGNLVSGDGCSAACTIEPAQASSTMSSASASPGMPDGSVCTVNSECRSLLCFASVCRGDVIKIPEGGTCNTNSQCVKGSCTNGICAVPVATVSSAATTGTRTSFATLQIQKVRLTTQGSTVALAWDPLPSTQLQAYVIYYGTTSGRYIQRRTISSAATDYALHSLPQKVTYYFAIRALSSNNEESAFSQEVAVEVGNPKSSTSPLTGRIVTNIQPSSVSGETGTSTDLALILILAAIAGTILASRRQIIALKSVPHPTES